jgi:hypothetical protein
VNESAVVAVCSRKKTELDEKYETQNIWELKACLAQFTEKKITWVISYIRVISVVCSGLYQLNTSEVANIP